MPIRACTEHLVCVLTQAASSHAFTRTHTPLRPRLLLQISPCRCETIARADGDGVKGRKASGEWSAFLRECLHWIARNPLGLKNSEPVAHQQDMTTRTSSFHGLGYILITPSTRRRFLGYFYDRRHAQTFSDAATESMTNVLSRREPIGISPLSDVADMRHSLGV